jgi:hypothetical protein
LCFCLKSDPDAKEIEDLRDLEITSGGVMARWGWRILDSGDWYDEILLTKMLGATVPT